MNKMYKGALSDAYDFVTDEVKEKIESTFNILDNWIDRLHKEEDVNKLAPATMQNLFWMIFNGLTEYEDAVSSVKLLEKAKTETKYINDEGNNFAWACGSTGRKHNEMRLSVFSDIFDTLQIN